MDKVLLGAAVGAWGGRHRYKEEERGGREGWTWKEVDKERWPKKGQKEGAAKGEEGQGRGGSCLLSSIRFGTKPVTRSPQKSCAQLLDAVRTRDSSSAPAATFPNLLDANAPFGPQPFREKKRVLRGTQKKCPGGVWPHEEESLQAGEHSFLSSLPVPALGPGSGIETDRALSRQKMYGPGGRRSRRRGKERKGNAQRPINTSEWEVERTGGVTLVARWGEGKKEKGETGVQEINRGCGDQQERLGR